MGRGLFGGYGMAAALVAALSVCAPTQAEEPAGAPLTAVGDAPLPGRANRFDYQSYDGSRHLLFVAHLGDGAVTAMDTRSQRVVANVEGLKQVHGVLAVPELGRVYASATGERRVVVIDEGSFEVIASIPAGAYPDGMTYVPSRKKLYVADKRGALVVIDAASNQAITTIPLDGQAGNVGHDPVSDRVVVNLRSKGKLAEIDPATDTVVALHPLPGALENHGLLIAPAARLAFVACEGNSVLLTLDLDGMRVVSSHPVGAAPDTMAFDPGLGLLYVASESGVLTIFRVEGKTVAKVGEVFVGSRAHSVAVAPDTHLVYLPLENVERRPVLRVLTPTSTTMGKSE